MKYKIVCLFVAVAALISLGAAQTSQVHSPGPKSGPDPLLTATQPLTPKSAMPAPPHKSSVVAPNASTHGGNTNAELNHLERQTIKTPDPQSGSAGKANSASTPKSGGTSAGNGSGINFTYQKPTGGMKASNPGANAANSSTTRVKKN